MVRADDTANGVSVEATVLVSGCALIQIYGENSKEVELLRNFRDNVLTQIPAGQEIIRLYYELSPVVVRMMEEDEGFREEIKKTIDGVLKMIGD